MKIVYISNIKIPSKAANTIQIMEMCNALSLLEHEVTLLVPEQNLDKNKALNFYDVESKFKIKELPIIKKAKKLSYCINIYKFLSVEKPHLVLGRFLHGCLIASLFDIPIAIEIHDPIPNSLKSKAILLRLILRKTTNILIVITHTSKKHHLHCLHLREDQVKILHDGARKINNRSKSSRKKCIVCTYLGSLYKHKGIKTIINLHKEIKNVISNIKFLIVGDRGDLRAEIESISKSSKNLILKEHIPRREIYSVLRDTDIALLPTTYSVVINGTKLDFSSPLKLFEYMSYGKGIIASKIESLKEVLSNKTSFLADPEDPSDWKQKLVYIWKNPKAVRKREINVRNRFSKHFTWVKRANQLLALLCRQGEECNC